jgi:predicted dehydrogenase
MTKVLVIGAGIISQEYCKVISELNLEFDVICQSEKSATLFTENTSFNCLYGGIKNYISQLKNYSHIIVACNLENAFDIAKLLLLSGAKNILLEKPGTLYFKQIPELLSLANENNCNVFIAYNRRFFSSTQKAKEIAKADGGITSAMFDFTEWSHIIQKLDKPKQILNNWFFANSTHIIDTVFFLIGKPKEISAYTSGQLDWHSPSKFAGSGETNNSIFSYHANWQSAGRWYIEIKTSKRALCLMPIEKLFEQEIGSIEWKEVPIDNEKDIQFKPGFYKQTTAFLKNDIEELKTLKEQCMDLNFYKQILGEI